jgi:hypothetical protein
MTQSAIPVRARKPMELPWDPEWLPPFPAIAIKALNLMSGTDRSLIDLCNLIRSDPAFSVAVLRIANAPLVAFSKNVTSVLQASMPLGFQRLRSLVDAFGLKAYIRDAFTPLMQSCWRHSVACAILAERGARWGSWIRTLPTRQEFSTTSARLRSLRRCRKPARVSSIGTGNLVRNLVAYSERPRVVRSRPLKCGTFNCWRPGIFYRR